MTAEEMWGIVDWHGNVVLDFTFDYASAVLIAPDATALLVDTDEGMAGYTIEGGLAAAPVSAADATDAEPLRRPSPRKLLPRRKRPTRPTRSFPRPANSC